MPITIDESRRPVVLVSFVGTVSDAEFDAYLEQMDRVVLGKKQQTVTILDATRSQATTAAQRKKQADWLTAHQDELRRYSLGTAFVIQSAAVRGVLTAIFWLQPLDRPYAIVATRAEGEAWANEQFRAAGVQPPPPLS